MRLAKSLAAASLLLSLNATSGMAEVVAVVSAKNAVTTLTRNQLNDIFLARTNRFPNGQQAVPVDQVEDSPARNEFYSNFVGKSPAQLKAHWSKIIFTGRGQPPKKVPSGNEVKKFLADNPNGIGYLDKNAVDGSVKIVTVIP